MLKVYYGRGNVDKDRFVFGMIKNNGGRTFVVVPSQYTLECEKQGLKHLNRRALVREEVLSFTRLCHNLTPPERVSNQINKYGRTILVYKIVKKLNKENKLQLFASAEKKIGVLEEICNFISASKLYEIPYTAFDEVNLDNNKEILKRKIYELNLIYRKYEEAISGKVLDVEDLIEIYKDTISQSKTLKGTEVWIYNFSSLKIENLKIIEALCQAGCNVNVFLTADDLEENSFGDFNKEDDFFYLAKRDINNLRNIVDRNGLTLELTKVPQSYAIERENQDISHLEENWDNVKVNPLDASSQITICKASSTFSECESAVCYIKELIEEKGLRYRDIAIINNDKEEREKDLIRLFDEYDINSFIDDKRPIINSPISNYVLSLLKSIISDYDSRQIMEVAKTGLHILAEDEDIENIKEGLLNLDNYSKITISTRHNWKKPFKYIDQTIAYNQEKLQQLNRLREMVVNPIVEIENLAKKATTYTEFIDDFYDYLYENKIVHKIYRLSQEDEGYSKDNFQIWNKIIELFKQLRSILYKEEDFNLEDFYNLLEVGMSNVTIGNLPDSMDSCSLGACSRSRLGAVKAVLFLGCNEGNLPSINEDNLIFTKRDLSVMGETFQRLSNYGFIMNLEEELSIYNLISMPSNYLWFSFAQTNSSGEELLPSRIISKVEEIIPKVVRRGDVSKDKDIYRRLGGSISNIRHLTDAYSQAKKGMEISSQWSIVENWIKENQNEDYITIKEGMAKDSWKNKLSQYLVDNLLCKDSLLELSPTALEKYSNCPFAFFIQYGLRLKELRLFKADSRDIGDFVHGLVEHFCKYMDREKRWDTVSMDQVKDIARSVVVDYNENHSKDVFNSDIESQLFYENIVEMSEDVFTALIEQHRKAIIKKSYYEIFFGKGGSHISPLSIPLKNGKQTLQIKGKIDRIDLLGDNKVRIIDYKTGQDKFDLKEVEKGLKLQLMIYLLASKNLSSEMKNGNSLDPAGLFYFKIKELMIKAGELKDANGETDQLREKKEEFYKLDGLVIGEDSIDLMDTNLADTGMSNSIPVKLKKDGQLSKTSKFISREEYINLEERFIDILERLGTQIQDGNFDVYPVKTGKQEANTSCVYCGYRGICQFDPSFKKCNYHIIK